MRTASHESAGHFGPLLCGVFSVVLAATLFTADATLRAMLLVNAVVQLVLFLAVAVVPFLRTGRMSYVDIAWPFGVALIGAQVLLVGDGAGLRRALVGGVYLLVGLRMGVGAVAMGRRTGVIFRTEFPRYVYRRESLEGAGGNQARLHMLAEILAQGMANASVLAIPGFLMAVNATRAIAPLGVAGASALLYLTLNFLTGAVPAEHYSVRKRPGYREYQRTTNRFFPWFPRP